MTDEEKAEEYAIENWEHYEEGQTDYKALKHAVLYGLAEGREETTENFSALEKENTKLNKTNNTLYKSVFKVGKRNNELKSQVEELEKEKCELLGLIQAKDKQIEKMKSDWADAKKKVLELLNLKTMRIEQLEAQIEKMKCCHNCRNLIDKSYCVKPCIKHNKWELAE